MRLEFRALADARAAARQAVVPLRTELGRGCRGDRML